jgi:glyoxylase-like metal-dependent hydrolase (beta-lactamase superfamily II)
MRSLLLLFALALAACATPQRQPLGHQLIPGTFEPNRGPDGNSIFLDAPDGLILVDTGRHPAHRDRLLAYARERGRPIVAIVNTHWHLDHSTGNAELRSAFPQAPLYASTAIEGALRGFIARSRRQVEAALAAGQIPEANLAEVRRALAVMDNPDSLRPTRPIARSQALNLGGRRLRLHLAPFAATEGDVWVHDPAARLVIAGDLVVGPVPFFDTACPDGWRRALDRIAATRFATLIPGHGEPMGRAQFLAWRGAFNALLDCAASPASRDQCIAGWRRDAAQFLPADTGRIDAMVSYYLDTRLRAAPDERNRYCRPDGA